MQGQLLLKLAVPKTALGLLVVSALDSGPTCSSGSTQLTTCTLTSAGRKDVVKDKSKTAFARNVPFR